MKTLFSSLVVVGFLVVPHVCAAQVARFDGVWVNPSPSGGLIKVVIQDGQVHAYGVCHPNPCDWGITNATVYAGSVSDNVKKQARAMVATYRQGSTETILVITPQGAADLQVEMYTRFTGADRRSPYTKAETFRRDTNAPTSTPEHNQIPPEKREQIASET